MTSSPTTSELLEIRDPTDLRRVVRVRIEGPSGYRERDEPLPHVLVVHGFKGFMSWGFFPELSRRVAAAGFVAVSIDTSGCGIGPDLETFTELEAFERDTATRELEDLDTVRALVLTGLECVDRERLGIVGHSRGGAATLLHAACHPDYRAVTIWSSIDSFDRFDDATKAEWRRTGFLPVVNARTGQVLRVGLAALEDIERNRAALDVLAACAEIRAPTLVVHGSADETVELACSERIAAALPAGVGRRLIVDGAGHAFGATHPLQTVTPELALVFDATVEHLRAALGR